MSAKPRLLLGSAIAVLASASPTIGNAGVPADAIASGTSQAEATIIIGSVTAARGEPATFDVQLETTAQVEGTFNEIVFGPEITLDTDERGPTIRACMGNPAIQKPATTFQFDCDAIGVCRLRVVVFSSRPDPIPSGSVLYSCRVVVTDMAQDGFSYPLSCQAPVASENGQPLDTACVDGIVTFRDPPPTFISPTATPDRPATPGTTATGMPPVSATNTPPPPGPSDDGCQVVPAPPRQLAWLLVAAPVLFALSRRNRPRHRAGQH